MSGLSRYSPAQFKAWNGLHEGALSVHNRRLVLEVLERLDYGDAQTLWRIRLPATASASNYSATQTRQPA